MPKNIVALNVGQETENSLIRVFITRKLSISN